MKENMSENEDKYLALGDLLNERVGIGNWACSCGGGSIKLREGEWLLVGSISHLPTNSTHSICVASEGDKNKLYDVMFRFIESGVLESRIKQFTPSGFAG